MARFSRTIKGLLAVIGTALVLCLLAPLVLTTLYKDRIVGRIKQEFSRHSRQTLADFEVGISLIDHFPFPSVELHNISIRDTRSPGSREVLGIGQVHVILDVRDFFRERWSARKIILEDLQFRQWVDSTGRKTGFVWRAAANRQPPRKRAFTLPQLLIRNATIAVENRYKQSAFSIVVERADLHGRLDRPLFQLQGTLKGTVQYLTNRDLILFRQQPFTADARYNYHLPTKTGTILPSRLTMNGSEINVLGTHTKLSGAEGSQVAIQLAGSQPGQVLLSALLPDSLKKYVSDTALKSRVVFQYRMQGISSPTLKPRSQLSFLLTAKAYRWPHTAVVVDEFTLRGKTDNGIKHSRETASVTVDQFYARLGNDTVKLQGRITNFDAPLVEGTVVGRMGLKPLAAILRWPGDSLYAGQMHLNLALKTPLPDSSRPKNAPLPEPIWNGSLWVKDGAIRLVRPAGTYTAIKAHIDFVQKENKLLVKEASGRLNGKPFQIDGEITNVLWYWLAGATRPIHTRLAVQWPELSLMGLLKQPSARPVQAGSAPRRPSPLIGLLANTSGSAVIRVGEVNLPSQENLKNVSIVLRKQGDQVRMPQIRFETSLGGRGRGVGHFRWRMNSMQSPFLALQLSYDYLNLQRSLGMFSGFHGVESTYRRGPAHAGRKPKGALTDYRIEIELMARRLVYTALRGDNFQLKANILGDEVQLERLRMNAFNGMLSANGVMNLEQPANGFPITLQTTLRQVDLHQVFQAADELNLDVLRSRNIRGNMDCSLSIRTRLDKNYLPNMENTTAYIQASLRGMELIEVLPIQEALRFLSKAKTSHIYFEDVDTRFLLSRNRILIPEMNLSSNLSYLNLSGDYTLNKEAIFLMEVSLMDLLFGNNKRRIRQIQEDGANRPGMLKNHLWLRRSTGGYQLKVAGKKDIEAQKKALLGQMLAELNQYRIDTTYIR